MYSIDQVRHLHLEISSRCNASCPLCPRNFYGYPYNDGYVEHDMSLAEARQIFAKSFIQQLTGGILINGNFGDAVMNSETVDIVKYFKGCFPEVNIRINTNGGARNRKFWQDLAGLDVEIAFSIDGLEDTHSIYRQNTKYQTVIKNAQTFIKAGGRAIWKFIKFDHNQHQIEVATQLSKQMGFQSFKLVDHGRNTAPVFNKHKKLIHVIGKPTNVNFDKLFKARQFDEILLDDIIVDRNPKPIDCKVKKEKSMYVSSVGKVYPCCFLGFNPTNFGHGNYQAVANAQLRPLIDKNNADEYGLKNSITWFNNVEKSWSIPSFEQGRLVICDDVCGQKQ